MSVDLQSLAQDIVEDINELIVNKINEIEGGLTDEEYNELINLLKSDLY